MAIIITNKKHADVKEPVFAPVKPLFGPPAPAPKVGDEVLYVAPNPARPMPLKVAKVHEGHEGRLIDLEQPEDPTPLVNIPFRPVPFTPEGRELPEELRAGTWHWPPIAEQENAKPESKGKRGGPKEQ